MVKNNIFNIRHTNRYTWCGQTGQRRGFCEFETLDAAVRAWLILMRTYRRKYGCKTIRQIVTRFAPPSENDTSLYILQMASWTGLKADYELHGIEDYGILAMAMARKETGSRISNADVMRVARAYKLYQWAQV